MLVIGRSYWVEPIQEVEEEVEGKEADLTEGGTAKLADETIENSVEGTTARLAVKDNRRENRASRKHYKIPANS